MRDKLMQFLTRNLVNIWYILLTDFSQKSTVATVSRICGSNGTGDNYSIQNFTIRKITGNLPIAGKNTKESLFPPFLCKCFSKIFSEIEEKNYGSFSHVLERYQLIKPDRILSAENIKKCQL
jgi:hypothetical protein